MKRRDWIILGVIFTITLSADLLTKAWALAHLSPTPKHFGIFGLALHFNKGAMLGLFADFPPLLRTVTFSTFGAFLVFAFLLINFLLPIRTMALRTGLSIFLAGLLGNIIDRVTRGHVVDFLFMEIGGTTSGIFNLADLMQWPAVGLILYALTRDNVKLWPLNNARKGSVVNPGFQTKYCLLLVSSGLGSALISGVFAYTFLRSTMIELLRLGDTLAKEILFTFILFFVLFQALYAIILFFVARKISGQAAGPIYAFERYVDRLLQSSKNGQELPPPLKFRQGDDFRNLESVADKISKEVVKR